jgi:3-hydroxyisobutyrate dehydrogenase-like beta-hydroxyacid dehydrogenase
MAKVAYLGTGLLGSAIAEGMLRRGDAMTVWNRTPSKARALEKAGATVASTPGDAVAGAERVHLTLSDDAAVDGVMEQFLPRLATSAVVIDHTTTSPRGTVARYERLSRAGVRFLHVPVFMSPQMARESIGLSMCSGPQAIFDEVRGALQNMTGEAWYLGHDPGKAAAYKLFGNSMIFTITAGVSDVLAMARGLGMSLEDSLQVFSKFQPGGVIKARGEKMARRDFSASFELTMARKDMRLMLEAASGQPTVVLSAIAGQMDRAIAQGHGQDDLAALAAEVVR